MAMLVSLTSFAASVEFVAGTDKTADGTTAVANCSLTKDGITIKLSNGCLGRDDNYRIYQGQYITVTSTVGNITSIEFTCTANGTTKYGPGCFDYRGTEGTYAYEGKVGTWTGDAAEVILYASAAQVRATQILVSYTPASADFVDVPTILGAQDFVETTEVSLNVSEGLSAYYTLDGTEPTTASNEYAAPFTLDATTTVKAVAYNATTDKYSAVVEKTFTKATALTCAEAAEIAMTVSGNNVLTDIIYVVKGYVTEVISEVSYNQQRFWVADTKDGGQVLNSYYCNVPRALVVGDYVQMVGKLTKYNTTPQMKNGDVTILPEPVAPAPCTEATPVNWDDKIELEANADKWYLMDLTTAIEAGKDLEFNLVNTSADSVVVTVEAHDACPTDEFTLLQSSTQTIEANASKSKVLGYADFLAGQVEQMYIHVITKGGALSLDMEQVEPAPTTETVYFVNAQNWTGTINAYAWDPVQNANWPGVAATKEAEQIGGYDVYSYTAEAGTYKNIIFNGTGGQTADLVWTAGKYYVKDGWYTKEEAEAQLAKPVEYESVYFVNAQGWSKVNIYTWTPEVGGWPGVSMTKEAEQLAGYDVYSYTVEKGTSFGGMLFNNTTGLQTGDLKWTAGKYYVKDGWYTKEEAEAKLAAPVVVTWTMVGQEELFTPAWTPTAVENDMEKQEDGSYVLVLENKTLEAGAYEYKAVKDHSWDVSIPQEGNYTLSVETTGEYNIVFTVNAEATELTAEATYIEPEIEWIPMDLEITNLTTEVMEVEGAKYLQLMGRDDMNDADVILFLNNYADVDDDYEVNAESSYMTFGGMELTVLEGVMTQTSETDKGTIYTGTVRASVEEEGETMYVEFALTMYAAPATVLVLTDAIVAINEELGTLTFNVPTGEGEGYYAELAGYTAPGVHEGPQICLFMTPEAVAYTNYAETSVADGIITLKGEFVSPMGPKFDVTISGKLPKTEPVEKPEPTYTENQLNTYAFGLESELTEEALNVTYRLNNSNATSVNVLVYKGEEVVATVAGTTTIGVNTVVIPVAELPAGVQLTWAVEVNGTSVEVPTQESKIYSFYHPSGLDIDNNPENATFGMLLINEGMQSVVSKTDGYVSAQFGAGIFAFTPSLDLIPNGDKPGYNGGIEFTTGRADAAGSTAYSPRRIRISEDGRIFVTSLNTDGNYLWEVNPDNLDEWTSVFQGTLNDNKELIDADSNFVAAPNNGFDVKGAGENLQLAMYSVNLPGITAAAMSGFRLHEYNLGTATEWATAPSKTIVDGLYAINYTGTQVEYDNEGGVWIASYRGTASDANPGLVHINADGVEDAKLIWSNVRQAGIRFNNDFTKLVVAGNNGAAKKATIYAVSKDANGAPVLTEETVIDMSAVGNNLNDFAWDYAGNLYACGNSAEKLIGWAMPYSGQVVTPAAAKYAFEIEGAAPVEMVGVVKRAVQNGDAVIVLTHEADGTAHIYEVVDGVAVAELSQEGVIARDPENAGDLLAISDIAVTEDGKLVAINYMHTQAGDSYVNEGQKRGETRVYLWNDLAGDPSILFTSKMSSNWFRSKQGLTMAVKGTSDNMEIFTTGIHATSAWARVSSYRVIDGVYVEPEVNHNDHYFFYDVNDAIALETTVGTQYELSASPLGEMNWVLDAELINPTEIVESATNNVEITTAVALTEDLGKKYNGASYVTIDGAAYVVAPFANPDGELVGVEILNITNGFDAPQYVDMVYVEEAVAATAAATAVEVVEGGLNITLVADATIHTWFVELSSGSEYEVYEDEITNLVIDLDNLVLIGGPSSAFQVDVFLGLGDYNRNDDTYQLIPESSISVMGSDATFIEGYAYEVDAFTPSAKAVVRCEWNGMKLEFHLTMTAEPMEATVVVVEDAKVEIEKYQIWGDMYDYALTMTGEWINPEDGLTYPVLVEIPVYYPDATEPSEIMSTVTVGGWGDEDPWLGFGEGTLTVTTVNNVVTATGIVQNPMAGVAIDITISGKLPQEPVKYTVTATVNPAEAGTVEGAGEYEENAEVTLIATAAEGYEFVNWTVAGEEVSTDATYTFTVTADVEVVANFKAKVGSGVANIQTGVNAIKTIKNGQLIITKDGKEYNAQGAILK